MTDSTSSPRHLWISGHRGFHAREIENTRAAFARAAAAGIDYVEFDVKRTRDGQLIVFHDGRVDRLLDGHGAVEALSWAEIRQMRYADGQRVLRLDEFLAEFRGRVKFLLEIKSRGIGARVVRSIREHDVAADTIVQSFTGRDVTECHALAPDLQYGLCLAYVGRLGPVGRVLRLHHFSARLCYHVLVRRLPVTWLNLDGPFLYDEFLDYAHRRGKRVILGARRTARYVPKLAAWHVEMVNADDPVAIRARVRHHWGPTYQLSPVPR